MSEMEQMVSACEKTSVDRWRSKGLRTAPCNLEI
jgi:hypothetical protein